MLTAMKLSGDVNNIAAYHSREENYYFSQADNTADLVTAGGLEAQVRESLEYVKAYGGLCGSYFFEAGQRISELTFANLLNGHNAFGDKVLRKHKVHGIDLTFSAPKSVSIAGLVLDKDPSVIHAHDAAVLETMAEIELAFAYAQPKAGVSVQTGKMLYVTVRDGFSREHDPHLHTHVVVMNATELNGKLMGLDMKKIFSRDFNKVFGAIYRTRVASKLQSLGYNITYTKKGEWRLDKVSFEAELEFSKRRQQILAAEKAGQVDMDAWRGTRKDKNHKVNKEDIKRDWQERIERTNKTSERDNKNIAEQERSVWAEKAVWNIEAVQERLKFRGETSVKVRWQLALRRATEQSAHVSKNVLITEYLTESMRAGDWDTNFGMAEASLKAEVAEGHIIEIEKGRYTSWEMVRIEREYLNHAGTEAKGWRRAAEPEVKEYTEKYNIEAKNAGRKCLSSVQNLAVEKVISNPLRITVVQGDAGAGKTTALKAVVDYYNKEGIKTIGLAMQGVAAKNLETEAGCKSQTLAAFLSEQQPAAERTEPGRVLIFDEASMLDSRNAAELFKRMALNNDKIVLVGDTNQLESLGAGKVFARLLNDAKRAGGNDFVILNENYRQRDEQLREAVSFARKGKMLESLNILEEKGDITEIADKLDRRAKVATLYNKDTLIITGSSASKEILNKEIREKLLKEGLLKTETEREYNFMSLDQDGIDYKRVMKLTEGDKISFAKNEYKKYDIRNGERGEILETRPDSLRILLEDKREIDIDTQSYKFIEYGYATTSYKAQGQTYNKVVIEADTSTPSLLDMRNQYVNITRARDEVKIFTDDKSFLKDLADIKTHAKDTLNVAYSVEDIAEKEASLEKVGIKELTKFKGISRERTL